MNRQKQVRGRGLFMKKMLFVFNPHTSGGKLKGKILQILCDFKDAGYLVTAYPTSSQQDAYEITKKVAHKYELVVCCGGDGTLNEVTNGLMKVENPPQLGYIPGGTTNDFASSVSIPKNDMNKAVKKIINCEEPFAFDVGIFNGRVFNYIAAFGAFTDVSYATPQKSKNTLGYFAYLLEAAQRLPNLKTHHVRVETESGEVIEDDFLYGMISNSTSVGGIGLSVKSKIKLDDGKFEIFLLRKPQNLGEYTRLPDVVTKGDVSSPAITALKISKARIHSPEKLAWTVDGEFGGTFCDSEIEVKKQALKLRV